MNERIRELAVIASTETDWWDVSHSYIEKFAELIVKECAALVKGQPHVDKMMDCNSVIKQHFGVEE